MLCESFKPPTGFFPPQFITVGQSVGSTSGFGVFRVTIGPPSSYTLVQVFPLTVVPGYNSADADFGRRVITLGGRCGFAGVRAPAVPTGHCNVVVSATGGSRGGALYAMQRTWG
jgi:hypothetical protein